MSNRRTWTDEDRLIQKTIEDSTKVSNNLLGVMEAINTGNIDAAKGNVPNYAAGNTSSNEEEGLSMDMQAMFVTSQNILGTDKTSEIINSTQSTPSQSNKTTKQASMNTAFKISRNQWTAIKKYPNLVEFLGTEHSEKIVQKITTEINIIVAQQIEKNSQVVNEYAKICVAKKQNLHQFFQGSGWVCQVTAHGPFTGKEAIFYHEENDKAFILRKYGESKYEDVSSQFNIVHDFKTTQEELDINNLDLAE